MDIMTAIVAQSADQHPIGTYIVKQINASQAGSVIIRCPVAVANNLTITGCLLIGWTFASVQLLEARPLQCYRCLEKGHIRQRCYTDVDCNGLCYLCGEFGHVANGCSAKPHCPVCSNQASGELLLRGHM